eukprot:Nk52_evm20s164 gene=Nk52_evmTU20s164
MAKVFVSCVDCFKPGQIAKAMSKAIVGALKVDAEEEGEDEVENKERQPYEIWGTLSSPDSKKPSFVTKVVDNSHREFIRDAILECDVIIYDIGTDVDQVEECSWCVEALQDETDHYETGKIFICLSTVMTWARTRKDSEDPELAFTEDNYRKRKAHPNFKSHLSCEKLVIKCGKKDRTKLNTYVINAGLTYGEGEDIFHCFFKSAWQNNPELLCFGEGTNILPTIHIADLSSIVLETADSQPEVRYLLAVDESKNSFEQIVKAISETMGTGKVRLIPKEEALLIKNLPQSDYDTLLADIRMDPQYVKEMHFEWKCEYGIIEMIKDVVKEYRTARNLEPFRIFMHGPPASGKTYWAEKLAKKYKLHHIKLKDVIQDEIDRLEASAARADEEPGEDDDPDLRAQAEQDRDFLAELKESAAENSDRYPEEHVIQFIRDRLLTMPCQNQGYILDGYPKTVEQTTEFFRASNEDEDNPDGDELSKVDQNIIPQLVFSLEATDDFLKERIMNLPESEVSDTHNTEETFLRRLEYFRSSNSEDETVLNFFDELEIHPIVINVDQSEEDILSAMTKSAGPPRNYGPTPEELEEMERIEAEERMIREARELEERNRRAAEEAADRERKQVEWKKRLDEVKRQEKEVLEAQSVPLRNYLMTHVMPTLTASLSEVCKVRPDDPIDYLAEYLFKHNPQQD